MMEHKDLLNTLAECISMCDECVYNVCLGDPAMRDCGQLCIDCADTCRDTHASVSRGSRFMHDKLTACGDVCQICAEECDRFQDNEDMRRCAEICKHCASMCRDTGRQQRAAA